MRRQDRGPLTVYTIGHGARSKETFLQLLKLHNVRFLVDVRRWPASKTTHFRLDEMKRWLKASGIRYIWLGERLGGYRRGGYTEYIRSGEFKAGVEDLLRVTEKGRTCIMCLEVSPKGCHRRLITQHLSEAGVRVIHILSKKKVECVEPHSGREKGSTGR